MAAEVKELLGELRMVGAYSLFCALHKSGSVDKRTVTLVGRLIPPRERRIIRKRILLFLFWNEIGYPSRKTFLRRWRKARPCSRRKMLERFKRKLQEKGFRSFALLVLLALKDGMPSRQVFEYCRKPIRTESERCRRIKLYWLAILEEGCNVRVVGKVVELRMSSGLTYLF